MEATIPIKHLIEKALTDLPDDASLEDAIERIYLVYEIEQGLMDIKNGQTVSMDEAKRRLSKWLR